MPEKLQKLNLSHLHHAEYAQLVARFIDEYEAAKLKTTDDDLKRLLATIRQKLSAMQNALEQVVAHEKSEAVSLADKERDIQLRALFESIRAYRYTKVVAEQDAYNTLHLLFKQYKETWRKSYEEETSLIHSLLEKLKTGDYHASATALGLTKFVVNLSDSHAHFNRVFAERIKEERNKPKYNMKVLRRDLAQEYRLLVDYIDINARVKTDKTYKQLLLIMNSIHKYYADNLARRKGKLKAAATEKSTASAEVLIDERAEE